MAGGGVLASQLLDYGKFLAASLLFWMAGYWNLSVAWVGIVTLFIYIWVFDRPDMLRIFNQKPVKYEIDHNSAWLSKVFSQLWPHASPKFEQFMRSQLQCNVKQNLPSTLNSFSFTDINLGEQVPNVLTVDVKHGDSKYIILDIEMVYSSDAEIGFSVGQLESIIQNIHVHGTLRVVLTNLNSSWPFFGKINLSFVSPPQLDFRLSKIASFLDVVGFRDIIHESVVSQISEILVLPHYITIPVNNEYINSSLYTLPMGILRVRINSAKDLFVTDNADQIDPYCVLQVGAIRYKTDVIQKTRKPLWNDLFDFYVFDVDGQYLEIQCIDSSDTNGSGSLGSCYLNVKTILSTSGKSCWLNLDKTRGGSVSITSTWLTLSEDPDQLSQPEMIQSKWKSTGLLSLGVESALNLPKALRSISSPSAYTRITISNKSHRTSVIHLNQNPAWGENFLFLLTNPNKQDIMVEVIDDMTDTVLGRTQIYINSLLNNMNITSQSYKLTPCTDSSDLSESHITLSLTLRILTDDQLLENLNQTRPDNEESAEITLTTAQFPVVSTPQKKSDRIYIPALSLNGTTPQILPSNSGLLKEGDNSSGGQSDLLDFESWSEADKDMGGATFMVISRPDGLTVSEIIQNADENTTPSIERLTDLSALGKMQVTLRYSVTQQRLMIVLHQCVNLRRDIKDQSSQPDPFVVITLYQGRTRVDRKKTKTQKSTLNPIYDETFEFKQPQSSVDQAVLEMRVKNKRRLFQKGKASMGSVVLNISALDLSEARTEWFIIRTVHESMESLNDTTLSQKTTR